MKVIFEWTKAGSAAEDIEIDEVNIEGDSARATYDVCATFDNVNNQFHVYLTRACPTSGNWSYTYDFLYGTTSLTGTPENCIVSDTSPTNYPEDVTWTSLYLLNGNQADIYQDNTKKTELKYAMIVDDFVPPTEFNWIHRLYHYWQTQAGIWPK